MTSPFRSVSQRIRSWFTARKPRTHRHFTKLSVEHLEHRLAPAINVAVVGTGGLAKQGKLIITISNLDGFLNGDSLADFLSTARFYLTIGANKYEFVPTATVAEDGSLTLTYSLKNSALLQKMGDALSGANSGANAIEAGLFMESTDYTFAVDNMTRLFSTVR